MSASAWMAGAVLAACSTPSGGNIAIEQAIRGNAARFGIPATWIAGVMAVESGGRACFRRRLIRSRAGAAGLMQLMKPTWIEMQSMFGLGSSVDDPATNIAAGAAYLRLMYDRFGFPGVFAAYNAGPQRYRQSLMGRPLPTETLSYLNKVLTRIEGPSADLPSIPNPRPVTLFVTTSNMLDIEKPDIEDAVTPSADRLFILRR